MTLKDVENHDNLYKVTHGLSLNNRIEVILDNLLSLKYINNYLKEPKYSAVGFNAPQFNPDFEITMPDNSIIVVDNTTTIRSDRMKQKQWDALGIKTYFKNNGGRVSVFTIVPNEEELGSLKSNKKEVKLYLSYKNKIKSGNIFSAIDDILQVNELIDYICTFDGFSKD